MATTVLSPLLLRRGRRTRGLRRALALVWDPSPNSSPSPLSPTTSSTSSFSTSPPPRRDGDDDLLSSLIDHERTGVPAGAGVAGGAGGFDLSRMHRLLARLGNPHASIPATIHVVGSKGKGSTAAMVAAAAGAAGLRVAALSSPHVRSRRERIAFGGGMLPISEAEFDALVEAHAGALRAAARDEEARAGGARSPDRLSAFEVMVALGLRAAADRGCDLAVIEAGLGGATDATNVFGGGGDTSFSSVAPPPSAVVLSSMSLEHAAALGGSLETVVRAKCGVLRRGVPAVLARQVDSKAGALARAEIERVGAVLVDAAAAAAAAGESNGGGGGVSVASCELVPSRGRASPPRTKVKLKVSGALAGPFLSPRSPGSGGGGGGGGERGELEIEAELRLFGEHQADNAAAAAAAALSLSLPPSPSLLSSAAATGSDDLLRRRAALAGRISPDALSRGLSGATLPGRFHVARLPLANGGVRWKGGGGGGGPGGSPPSLSHLTSALGSPPLSSSSSPSSAPRSIPVVLDGAHTPASAAALSRALSAAWPGIGGPPRRQPRMGIVLACAGDKDLRGIAAALRSPPSALARAAGGAGGPPAPPPPPPLRPCVVVFTEVPIAGGFSRSAPPGELAAAWQAAVGAEPLVGPSGRCRVLVKASLGAAVDAAARELTSGGGGVGGGGFGGDGDEDAAVLVVTGSLHAVGEALRVLPLEEVIGV